MEIDVPIPEEPAPEGRRPSLWQALIPVFVLIIAIAANIRLYGGDPHIPLAIGAVVAGLVGKWLGFSWRTIDGGIVEGIRIGLGAILILMAIGILIGTWIAAGVVPMLISVGLQLLSPSVFLLASCLICCVVSIATGSSWTTAGTVGVALMGIAKGLAVPEAMAAGAVVSGAYFGDKMSPLSDSTNLAPAVAGSELFEHIRYMLYTTLPALVIALMLYAVLGMFVIDGQGDPDSVASIRSAFAEQFSLNPVLLLPPILVVAMVAFKLPALPSLLAAAAFGGILAMLVQGTSLGEILKVAQSGFVSETGNTAVDELLSGGGLSSMMNTVALILCALAFGGVMERTRQLEVIADAIIGVARSTGQLVAATVGTCIGMNVIAPDQYLSIVVPGRMYRNAFQMQGLHVKNLSRTLEDAGTLSSPLVPWNTCGAFMTTTLGVSSFVFLPYAFFNLLTPVVAIALAFHGKTLARAGLTSARQQQTT